ncbi:MAG: transposase [bacterium]
MKIDFAQVRECLKSFDFNTLFREHLGWDNYQSQIDIPVDGSSIRLATIAQKRGFVAFICDSIPDRSTRLKIDHQITKSVREHFVIYADQPSGRQVWQWVRREPGKPMSSRDHHFDVHQSGDRLIQRLEQIAISLDEEENITIVDVAGRARAAFDVDRITKRFYDRFKAEHTAFLKLIKGIKEDADLQWYTSLMLNRLMFVYFIQKKGFLDGDIDYLRNRLQMVQEAKGKDKFQSFYRYFLLRLFHEGLGKSPEDRKIDADLEKLLGKVPFLDGGFFEVHQIEERNSSIDIPDKAFEKLFDFFDQYSWHLDERPLRADNEINPDVVGYIFEKYINQKQMGAYYTKEDITEYISKNTIIPFLFDAAEKKCPAIFKKDGFLWRLLADNPDRYIYPAMRYGVVDEEGNVIELPQEIEAGIQDVSQRSGWNKPADDSYALPTEIWREHVARRQRCLELRQKLRAGEVHTINDLITLNLDIWQFARDAILNTESPEMLRAFWQAIEKVTILDPTCGSGAFLFAALRILETLYSDCLERMERFIEDVDNDIGTGMGSDTNNGTGVPPVKHAATVIPSVIHGQDAHATLICRQGAYLPHWTQEGATYAVTFRLFDSLPATVLKEWLFERENIVKTAAQSGRTLSDSERHRLASLHSQKIEAWLDRGQGCCCLRDERVAAIVENALRHFDGQRYYLIAWCIMPNHVHVVLTPTQGHDLPAILHSWKSYTSKEINRLLGRSGELWQSEYYDHLIRDEKDFYKQVEYVLQNPDGAGLSNWRWVGTGNCFTGVPPVKPAATVVSSAIHGQDAHATKNLKYSDFKKVLAQIAKHPNERYFILKSIIINNLFGVDIMEEAVEICKLRLFLKLVAQVEAVEQIEPLPDIDFNIRAGNTLIGYATDKQARKAFKQEAGGQMRLMLGDSEAVYRRFEEDVELIKRAFQQFRAQQTIYGGKVTHEDKQELHCRLKKLDDELDRYLAGEYGIAANSFKTKKAYEEAFAKWKASHQPFHWFVEFYGIMNSGGFDVIIGNPPYVELSKVSVQYHPRNFFTESCGNLYALCTERSFALQHENSRFGFIVQQPITSTIRMASCREVILKSSSFVWSSTYDDRPSKLFDGMHHARLAIILAKRAATKTPTTILSVTPYNKWFNEEREHVFQRLAFITISVDTLPGVFPKISTEMEVGVINKMLQCKDWFESWLSKTDLPHKLFYKITGVGSWFTITPRPPKFFRGDMESSSTRENKMAFASNMIRDRAFCILNSTLFYWFYQVRTNCRDFNPSDYKSFPVPKSFGNEDMSKTAYKLKNQLDKSAEIIAASHSITGAIRYEQFRPRTCKPIIDEIDRVLARHYGFTEEELDFIINYDIKYRMGLSGGQSDCDDDSE